MRVRSEAKALLAEVERLRMWEEAGNEYLTDRDEMRKTLEAKVVAVACVGHQAAIKALVEAGDRLAEGCLMNDEEYEVKDDGSLHRDWAEAKRKAGV